MKKNVPEGMWFPYRVLLKTLLVMKIAIAIVLITAFQVKAGNASGQGISLDLKNTDVRSVLMAIEKNSRYRFLYNFDLSGLRKKLDFNAKDASVNEVLNKLLDGNNLTYKKLNRNLIAILSTIESEKRQVQVRGKVTNASGEPLDGASVVEKGTTNGVITNNTGDFVITVGDGAVLVISAVGYQTQEVVVGNQTELYIKLAGVASNLDEVVVVGYGTQKRSSLTAAVSTIKGDDIVQQPVADLSSAMGGRAAGVLFTQGSGQAGNDAANVNIRGIATNGNNAALYIVDGIPRNYSQLNPADIESISILKDAAAVAPYGLGGANGVILITTKKGRAGKPVFSYNGYVGVQNPTVITKFVNAYQYATMKNIAAVNSGATDQPYSDYDLQKYKDGSDPDGHPDFQPIADMILRNTIMTGHDLSLNGGTENIKYAMGLGYLNQQGMFPGMKYQRYNLSGNMEVKATKTTTVGLLLNGRVEQRNLSGAGYNYQSIFENLINSTPISTPKVYSNGLHPYMYAYFYDNPSYVDITGNTMLTQFSIEQKLPIPGLSVKFVGAYDWNPYDPFNTSNAGIAGLTKGWYAPFSYYTVDTTQSPYDYVEYEPTTSPSFSEEYHQTQAFTYQGYINYVRNFGKNALTGLIVLESRNTKSSKFSASKDGYNIPIPELFAGSNTNIGADGTSLASKQRSLVYRLTYGYNNKYLLEAAGRYDGHYYFAPGHRFGFFPAFSAAWRISQEQFMQGINWLNDLKIRASYGQSGNLAGAAFQYQSGYNLLSTSSVLSGTLTQGLQEAQVPNPDITWERAKKTDIGFDARLLKNTLSIEADYFFEKRSNMLVTPNVTVPAEYGIGLSQVNAGSMENQGFELTANFNYGISNELHAGLAGNFSYAKNKLLQVYESAASYNKPGLRQTGRPLGTQFGYKAIGFFSEDDFDASGNLKEGIASQTWSPLAPGEIRYADVSGSEGVPDGVIDEYDEMPIGHPSYPGIVYGFTPSISYKGFELSVLFQGAGMRSVQLSSSAVLAFDNNKSAPITTLDYWTAEHTNATYPRLTTTPSSNTSQPSSFWERNASYLRLRTGMLSYTIPPAISKRMGMNMLKVYLSGQNIITWSPLKNFDPEVATNAVGGNTGRGWYFPTQKVVTFGVNVLF
ncbi:MAG: TonB-dependent receptor [Niabella sp.]